jgi:hypothetical protein
MKRERKHEAVLLKQRQLNDFEEWLERRADVD